MKTVAFNWERIHLNMSLLIYALTRRMELNKDVRVPSRIIKLQRKFGHFNFSQSGHSMERVTGIGGFFFRAANPEALGRWYQQNFGIDLVPTDYNQKPWSQETGETVFAPFPRDSDYFGSVDKQWMINFRVRSLNVIVENLRAVGVTVTVDPEMYPNGRFARLCDPEGNPIQLWEPK